MRRTNSEIEEILHSLDGITAAQARPFMHTRIMTKMQEELGFWGRSVGVLSKPRIAFSCLLVLISVNIYAIARTQNEDYLEFTTSNTALSSSSLTDVLQNDSYILPVK